MHTILLYANGRRAEGIILAATENTMRVIIKRRTDTVELQRVDGVWACEDGSPIQFESLVITGSAGLANFGSAGLANFETKALSLTAGGQGYLTD